MHLITDDAAEFEKLWCIALVQLEAAGFNEGDKRALDLSPQVSCFSHVAPDK
ncbi:hypothetical protein [Geothrix campi]|uniref:hypothetical protein n=1 Tax=Geothrix campi TaxID=2966450 RepID=UPI002147F028|nr:hypothetical protein [Geothrix sp. SG10]